MSEHLPPYCLLFFENSKSFLFLAHVPSILRTRWLALGPNATRCNTQSNISNDEDTGFPIPIYVPRGASRGNDLAQHQLELVRESHMVLLQSKNLETVLTDQQKKFSEQSFVGASMTNCKNETLGLVCISILSMTKPSYRVT